MMANLLPNFLASIFLLISLYMCAGEKLDVELIADKLVAPLDLTFAPNDPTNRRFIVEQNGLVYTMATDDSIKAKPFLDISERVLLTSAFDERGMLGFAFHPDYMNSGKVYALYCTNRTLDINLCLDSNGTTPDICPDQHSKRISEFTVSSDNPDGIDSESERILIELEYPNRKHNGGGLAFGPDGLLYIGLGDGGAIHGPDGNADALTEISPDLYFLDLVAQKLTESYGKIHRIDVDSTTGDLPYAIPDTNPFVDNTMNHPETIYAWGFRNPYRLTFDKGHFDGTLDSPANGFYPFYISATGETLFESTFRIDQPGNYGWSVREGSQCIDRSQPLVPPGTIECVTDEDCPSAGPQDIFCGDAGFCTCPDTDPTTGEPIYGPIIEYVNKAAIEHPESLALVKRGLIDEPLGRASLGGYIYRGSAIPWLKGKFVQGDFAFEQLDGQILIAEDPGDGSIWTIEKAFGFDKSDAVKAGFLKTVAEDANGELYAITGAFNEVGQIDGRIFKIVDVSSEPPTTAPAGQTPGVSFGEDTSAAIRGGLWPSITAAIVLVVSSMEF